MPTTRVLRRTATAVARGVAALAVAGGAAVGTGVPLAVAAPLPEPAPSAAAESAPESAPEGAPVPDAVPEAGPGVPGAAEPFTLAVIPDTQASTAAGTDTFTEQTRWIADHADRLGIAFVLHEGDVVNDLCDADQWERGSAAMAVLDDAGIPYAISPGNHDVIAYAPVCEPAVPRAVDDVPFTTAFPASRFHPGTYGGSSSPDSTANTFHTFAAGGARYLVLALQFGPRAEHLTWAADVVAAHPGHHALVLTHDLIGPDGLLRGARGSASVNALPSIPGTLNGLAIWDRLIAPSPTVQLTFNGHVADCLGVGAQCANETNLVGAAGRSVGIDDAGLPVHRMLANYQFVYADGAAVPGDAGFIRLLRFFPAARTVYVRTYSPTLDRYLTDSRNQFFLTGVDLGPDGRTTGTPPAPGGDTFTDTGTNAFRTEITAMRSVGVVGGYSDGSFNPTASISREAAAAMVYRATPGARVTGPQTCTGNGVRSRYSDVPDGHPFCWAIHELSRTGRISGYADGRFRPSSLVRRDAFAAFMFPRAGAQAPTGTDFVDVDTDAPLAVPVGLAHEAGVINGYRDGSFRPRNTITREAAAAMLARYYFPLA